MPPRALSAGPNMPQEQDAGHEEKRELGDLPWTHRADGSKKRAAGQWRGAWLGLLFLLLVPASVKAAPVAGQDTELSEFLSRLRLLFYQAVDSATITEETISFIESAFPLSPEDRPPVIQAYSAALEGLRGKHAAGLFGKLDHINKAVALLRQLPESYPQSLEIRFLRFSFFRQLPLFLGVRSTVRPDLAVLIRMLEEGGHDDVPPGIQRSIASYLLDCGEADGGQKERLRNLKRIPAASPSS
jgi:hypothetical protein